MTHRCKVKQIVAAFSPIVGLVLLALLVDARAQTSWQKDWKRILAAAEKEGQISIAGPPGDVYRFALAEVFQNKYPKIKVEYNGASGREPGSPNCARTAIGRL